MRLSGPVTWEICGGDVGDSLCIDVDDLGNVNYDSYLRWEEKDKCVLTRRRCSSSWDGTRGAMVGKLK